MSTSENLTTSSYYTEPQIKSWVYLNKYALTMICDKDLDLLCISIRSLERMNFYSGFIGQYHDFDDALVILTNATDVFEALITLFDNNVSSSKYLKLDINYDIIHNRYRLKIKAEKNRHPEKRIIIDTIELNLYEYDLEGIEKFRWVNELTLMSNSYECNKILVESLIK